MLTSEQGLSAIVDAAKNTGLCLFVGAGVSKGAGLPDFKTMIWQLVKDLGISEADFAANTDLSAWAQGYIDARSSASLYNAIREQLTKGKPSPTVVHQAFTRLGTHLKVIATTNYDTLLINAFTDTDNCVREAISADDLATLNGDFPILYIHGHISQPASLVISTTQYHQAREKKQTLLRKLQATAAGMPIVFVGFSGEDWNIRDYLHDMQSSFGEIRSTHYAINLNASLPSQRSFSVNFNTIGARTIDLAIADPNRYTAELARFFEELARRLDEATHTGGEPLIIEQERWTPNFVFDRLGLSHWVERDEARKIEEQLLNRQAVGIIGMRGRGGIGKTSLASHICQNLEMSRAFPDGIVLIRMRSRSMMSCLNELAVAFCMDELMRSDPSPEVLKERFLHKIKYRKLLIVLDNIDLGAELEPLLEVFAAAKVAVLLTARELLTTKIVWQELPLLDEEQSLQLLLQHCVLLRRKPQEQVRAFEREYLRGLPLAIKLAGIYLQAHVTANMESLGKQMAAGVQVLDQSGQSTSETSVRVCFDLSWQELTEDEQRIFILCAQIWESHTPHKMLQGRICRVLSMDKETVNAAFDILVNKGFLDHEDNADEGGAWSVHPILRAFGKEKAGQATELIDTRLLLGFDLDEIKAGRNPYHPLPTKLSLLEDVLERCEEQGWTEEFHTILRYIDQKLNNSGLWKVRKRWLSRAMRLQPDDPIQAYYLQSIGETYARMGYSTEALSYYQLAIESYTALNDSAAIAWLYQWLIGEYHNKGQATLVWTITAEAIWRNLADGNRCGLIAYGGAIRSLSNYGLAWQLAGKQDPKNYLVLEERIQTVHGNSFNVGLAIANAIELALDKGDLTQAKAELDRLKEQCKKTEHPELSCSYQLGCVQFAVAQKMPLSEIVSVAEHARNAAQNLGHTQASWWVDFWEGTAHLEAGQPDKGLQLLKRALAATHEAPLLAWQCHIALAEHQLDVGDINAAVAHIQQAQALTGSITNPLDFARLDLLRAALALLSGINVAQAACRQAGEALAFCQAQPGWLAPALQRLKQLSTDIDWQSCLTPAPDQVFQLPTAYCLPAILSLRNLPAQVHSRDGGTMRLVPSGWYRIGLNHPELDKEGDCPEIWLPPWYIDAYPVTNRQYTNYCVATHSEPPEHWLDGMCPEAYLDYPVNNVTIAEARAYAHWAGKRLPTREEWLAAASGPEGRRYPWGDNWDSQRIPVASEHNLPVMNFHPLSTFDEVRFTELLLGSLSLSSQEKLKVADAVPILSQFQIDELFKTFEEEAAEFERLLLTEGEHIKNLEATNRHSRLFYNRFGPRAVGKANDASFCGMCDSFGLIFEMIDSLGNVQAAGAIAGDELKDQSLFNFVNPPTISTRDASGNNVKEMRDYTLGFRCGVSISEYSQLEAFGLQPPE